MDISTRQLEIITAAGKILTTSGITGLTTKNLAKEMQFAESAIYRHFQSKEDIIIALLNYLAQTMDERLSNIDDELNTEEKFKELFQNQFKFFKKNPHFVVAVFSDGLMEESTRINETIAKLMQVKIKHIKPILAKGQQKGVFTDAISTEELTHIVMGTFRLLMYKWRISNFDFDIKKSGDKTMIALL
ncbi:MAG: TetR/AcrR family transcriptional regulator, partial [Bacteroidia bacterium]